MHSALRRRGFSLIELLVVSAIIGILASMGSMALHRSATASTETVCLNNLTEIALALNLYRNNHGAYPCEDLPTHLAAYVGAGSGVFICPLDRDPRGDSYSPYYVCRSERAAEDYFVGCPRHAGRSSTVALFTSASAQVLRTKTILWNGQPVQPGTSVGTGVLSFDDGSRVTIPADMVVVPVQSFSQRDGRLYSIIRVPVNETGALGIRVTPGSRFEVVTPSAIAGVRGTRFTVTTYIDGDDYCARVNVSEGAVEVNGRWTSPRSTLLRRGDSRTVALHRARMSRCLRKEWLERRVVLSDDSLYDRDDDEDGVGLWNMGPLENPFDSAQPRP